jgi:hypothetical protein
MTDLSPRPPSATLGDRIAAGMIILPCLLIMAAVAHHPVAAGSTTAGRLADILRLSSVDGLVHGAIMAGLLVLTGGLIQFSRRRGLAKPLVALAVLAQILAVAMSFVAMTFDGFVIPAIAARCPTGAASCLEGALVALPLASDAVQAFTRVGLALMAFATLLWSADLAVHRAVRLDRWTGIGAAALTAWILAHSGLAVSAVQFWALGQLFTRLTPHTLLLILGVQSLWYLAVATLLIRAPAPYPIPAA